MEEFRIIKGFENYEISNFGNVINCVTGKLKKKRINKKNSYLIIDLIKNKIRSTHSVHRLIATAFIPNPKNKPLVDHIDGNKINNSLENLRWATIAENNYNRQLNPINKLGFTGITFKDNKYFARITYHRKDYELGSFNTLEEAIYARVNKSKELFGEFQSNREKELVLNIKIPSNTKLTLNINIDDDYDKLEKEFEALIK